MNDAAFVRRFKRLGDGARDGQRFGQDQGPSHSFGERLAVDELQDQGGAAIDVGMTVDGADVRMIERSQDPCFTFEAITPVLIVPERPPQDLEGDVPLELCVVRPIHFAHTADAKKLAHDKRSEPPVP